MEGSRGGASDDATGGTGGPGGDSEGADSGGPSCCAVVTRALRVVTRTATAGR